MHITVLPKYVPHIQQALLWETEGPEEDTLSWAAYMEPFFRIHRLVTTFVSNFGLISRVIISLFRFPLQVWRKCAVVVCLAVVIKSLCS